MFRRIARVLLLTSAVAVTAAVALVVALSMDARYVVESFSPAQFDAEAWRAADERSRGSMVRDLIKRGLLIGRSRQDAVALLGPPDHERERKLLYTVDIGQRFASTPWPYMLHVNIDAETGLVTQAFYVD